MSKGNLMDFTVYDNNQGLVILTHETTFLDLFCQEMPVCAQGDGLPPWFCFLRTFPYLIQIEYKVEEFHYSWKSTS